MEKLQSLLDLLIKYLEQGTNPPCWFREIFLSGDFFGALIGALGAFGVAWFTIERERKKNREKALNDARRIFDLRYIPYKFRFPPRHEWSFGEDKEKDEWTWARSPKEEFEKMLKEDGLYPYFFPTKDFYATDEPKSCSAEKMTLKKIIEAGKPNNIAEHGVQIDGIECTVYLWAMALAGNGFVSDLKVEYYEKNRYLFELDMGLVFANQLVLIPLPYSCTQAVNEPLVCLKYTTTEGERMMERLCFTEGIEKVAVSVILGKGGRKKVERKTEKELQKERNEELLELVFGTKGKWYKLYYSKIRHVLPLLVEDVKDYLRQQR